jgi:hypothetical protein
MRYADALAAFRQYLEAGGLAAGDLDAPSAVTAMLGFYADERVSDVDLDTDGGIWQLMLTVHFRPDEETARLRSGNRWLERPGGIEEFARWIAGLPATAYCAGRRPLRTELVWDQV